MTFWLAHKTTNLGDVRLPATLSAQAMLLNGLLLAARTASLLVETMVIDDRAGFAFGAAAPFFSSRAKNGGKDEYRNKTVGCS